MLVNNYQKYQENAIATANPAELTLMLYNGAIKFCNQGIEAIENKNIQGAHSVIIKAQRIIEELQATLNDQYPIAKDIRPLYTYINDLLVDANITKDAEKLVEAKGFIVEFRDLWQQVMRPKR